MEENIVKIILLDSGIDTSHPIYRDISIVQYKYIDNKWIRIENLKPSHGHGTGVSSIIVSGCKSIEIHSFQLFDNELEVEPCFLEETLRFIYKNIESDIIHMSIGTPFYSSGLEDICDQFEKKGTILISAFDNLGNISYPAEFSSVIGVDASYRCTHSTDFVYVNSDKVNVKAKGGNQRMAWLNQTYIINQGSSFAAAYVTSYIASMFPIIHSRNDALMSIKKNAKYVYYDTKPSRIKENEYCLNIHEAAVFPYNKEVHSLIRFSHMLSFNIKHIYDSKLTGRVGLSVLSQKNRKYIIESIDSIAWDEIDTFIIGHTSEMEFFTKENIKEKIIKTCMQKNIGVYCFDSEGLEGYNKYLTDGRIYFPQIKIENDVFSKFGKLYEINTPVLGVFGTSNQQGKFTTQLLLRDRFIKDGYSVSQIGTEPEALLFEMDVVFPFGYKSCIELNELERIEYLNYTMHLLEKKSPDIILVGSQAGTIPLLYNNINNYTLDRLSFLLGTRPDAVVLCVNYHDEFEAIYKTIRGIESLSECKVIALNLFPVGYNSEWNIMRNYKTKIDDRLLRDRKQELEKQIGLPVTILGFPGDDTLLYNECVNFFKR